MPMLNAHRRNNLTGLLAIIMMLVSCGVSLAHAHPNGRVPHRHASAHESVAHFGANSSESDVVPESHRHLVLFGFELASEADVDSRWLGDTQLRLSGPSFDSCDQELLLLQDHPLVALDRFVWQPTQPITSTLVANNLLSVHASPFACRLVAGVLRI